jgi:hypothetical protein
MNMEIEYLYRDQHNYKTWNTVIVNGELSEKQIDEIISCLDERLYFIPSKVGLPENKFGEITEADHPWFELEKDGFTKTTEKPTVDITAQELYKRFLANKGSWHNSRKVVYASLSSSGDKIKLLDSEGELISLANIKNGMISADFLIDILQYADLGYRFYVSRI